MVLPGFPWYFSNASNDAVRCSEEGIRQERPPPDTVPGPLTGTGSGQGHWRFGVDGDPPTRELRQCRLLMQSPRI